MAIRKDNAMTVFRLHCAVAMLLFDEKNPGYLNATSEELRGMILQGSIQLNLVHGEERFLYSLLSPDMINKKVMEDTEKKYNELYPVAALAQTAIMRLLYRETKAEDEDIMEMMALELTMKLEASKIGILENDFWKWHRSMFYDDVNPQVVIKDLEDLISKAYHYDKNIFLSYRRDDSELLIGRISDRLIDNGFNVFYDKEGLVPGRDWKKQLSDEIKSSDIFLILIGEKWNPNRLFSENDIVFFEIAFALKLKKIIIPILINKAKFPNKEKIPNEIKSILNFQIAEIDSGTNFNHEIEQLIKSLKKSLKISN